MDCLTQTINLRFCGQSMDRLRKAQIFIDEEFTSVQTVNRDNPLWSTLCTYTPHWAA